MECYVHVYWKSPKVIWKHEKCVYISYDYEFDVVRQDPADGYYRLKHNLTTDISQPIVVIGSVVPCNCHQHADVCDRETGVCKVLLIKLLLNPSSLNNIAYKLPTQAKWLCVNINFPWKFSDELSSKSEIHGNFMWNFHVNFPWNLCHRIHTWRFCLCDLQDQDFSKSCFEQNKWISVSMSFVIRGSEFVEIMLMLCIHKILIS